MKKSLVTMFQVCVSVGLALSLLACDGSTGATGPEGPEGPPGEPGEPSEPGEPGMPPLDLEPDGLVGRILDPRPLPVAGGTVYLILAADVEELGQTPIDLQLSPEDTAALTVDEPLDDLIDTRGDTYAQATVDGDGVYRFTTLAEGEYYVTWAPDAGDAMHLPGGDQCREAVETAELVGTQLDIRVSGAVSEGASYVGSSTCMVCHGRHRSERTAHRVGLQATGARGNLQDVSPWPDFDEGLDAFENGTVLYYYDCDGSKSGFSKCKISESDQANVSFEVRLARDEDKAPGEVGAYYVEHFNRKNAEASLRYDVVLTYGGAVHKQRYVTRLDNADGTFSYYILTVQHNYEGDVSYPSSNNWPWRDYHSERWYDYTDNLLIEPAKSKAFDNNCAGCHFTGFTIDGDATEGWTAHAVPDANGAFDFDGDGRLEEINTGCEACHGPGSDHVENRPRGGYIVSPSLLTPGRELQICGRCHSRPQGIGAGGTDAPLSADNLMPPPGIRRADFALGYTQRVDGKPSNFHPTSLDSKSHHQQFSDLIRSVHYRNDLEFLTCSTCHDPHGNDENDHQLILPPDDNTLCMECHSDDDLGFPPLREHVEHETGEPHNSTDIEEFKCVNCHMVGTATSGAQRPQLLDQSPGTDPAVWYFHGDIAGHRFTPVQPIELASEQPVAATLKCAVCHQTFDSLPNPNPPPAP